MGVPKEAVSEEGRFNAPAGLDGSLLGGEAEVGLMDASAVEDGVFSSDMDDCSIFCCMRS